MLRRPSLTATAAHRRRRAEQPRSSAEQRWPRVLREAPGPRRKTPCARARARHRDWTPGGERHGAASLGGARTSPVGRWPGVTPTPARCPECAPGPPSAGLSRPCPDWLLLLVFLKPEVLVLSAQLSHAHFLSGSSGGAGRGPLGGPGVSSGGPLAERGSPRSERASGGRRRKEREMPPCGCFP